MFNLIPIVLNKSYVLILVLLVFISCKKEESISFIEYSVETSNDAIVALNYPKAEGSEAIATRINQTLEAHISKQINLSEDTTIENTVDEAIQQFNTDYKSFISDFPDAAQQWEALIDGEVTYRSPEVICIALNSYLDTGGAHGNTNVRFFNFDPLTGNLLEMDDLISNIDGLSALIKTQLKSEIKANTTEPLDHAFIGSDFKFPESIGYSDEGLIILYNPYEIASYAQGIVEFSIPFEDVNSYLNVH